MILRPRLVLEVERGRKTSHRLAARPADVAELREPMRRAEVYAVQRSAGKRAACHILVQDILLERLGDITDDELPAEGWPTRADFLAWWAVQQDTTLGELDLEQHVWVIRFELFRGHRPRLLAKRSELGYTTDPHRALRDAGEVLGDEDAARDRWQKLAGADATTPQATRPALELTEQDRELHRLILGRSGMDPEDVVGEVRHRFSDLTPGDVRRIRREHGVRAIDGRQPLTDEQQQLALTEMFAAGRAPSVRDVCRALDCSTTKASRLIADRTRPLAA